MEYKVIFDTNLVRSSQSFSNFLGNRSELERFLKISEIIIPDIVIEEIKNQKREHLEDARNKFLSNPFHLLMKINKKETKGFDIEKYITSIINEEKIPYTVISLTKNNVLEDMKKLCLVNRPPFEEKNDKGFKDAYIYFTVLEYLENCKNENVFIVTKDERLMQAFKDNEQLSTENKQSIVVKNFNEFQSNISNELKKEYFINRLKSEISENITIECLDELWLNTKENWAIKITCDEKTLFVEVDLASREIIDYTEFDFTEDIANLKNSTAFKETYLYIGNIKNYVQYFSDQEVQSLIEVASTNKYIYFTAKNVNVKEFFISLYEAKSQIISKEVEANFKKYFYI